MITHIVYPGKSFLPGFFRNFRPESDESFKGYLLRLAESNGYRGINGLLELLHGTTPDRVITAQKVQANQFALKKLGQMAFGEPEGLIPYFAEDVVGATMINDCRIDNDALMNEFAQVCPRCLSELGYALSAWDIAAIPGCTAHETSLLDSCQSCGQRLTWDRPFLMHCQNCEADLRTMPTAQLPAAVLNTIADFEALAPFRFKLHQDNQQVLPWGAGLNVLKLLALRDTDWWTSNWPVKRFFERLDVSARLDAITKMSGSRTWDGYDARPLRTLFLGHLDHLAGIPVSNTREKTVFELMVGDVAFLPDFAEALAYDQPRDPPLRGAEIFGGRPPILPNDEAVASFIDVDLNTVSKLVDLDLLSRPHGEELGYDLDHVMRAEQFLSENLLTLRQLRALVGVPIDFDDLPRTNLLPSWNSKSSTDRRVLLSHVVQLQQRIRLTVESLAPPQDPVELQNVVTHSTRPFLLVMTVIARLLNGGILSARWMAPYRWTNMALSKAELNSILAELMSKPDFGKDN